MSFRQDVQYASRTLRKSALLSVAVIATLTLGIGLDTGVFSMINAIAFRARVDKDPGSFLRVMTAYTKDLAQAGRWGSSTLEDYLAFRGARSVRDLAGVSLVFASLEQDDPRDVRALLVTCNFFSLYSLERPKLGRLLQPGDCSNSRPVMVMGEELWRERYAADPNIVGKAVHYNEQPLTVIGVAPASFAGRLSSAGGWLPYTIQPYLKLGPSLLQASETPWLQIMGRLSAGFSRQDVASELALLASQQDRSHAGRKTALLVTDGSMFQEPGMRERAVWTIPLIMGVLSLALLLACANVATLLLSRAVARHREIAVRLALGAGNARLLRMLFTENLLLACVAGAASIYLAYRVPPFLNHFFFRRPVAIPMDPDWRVFAYLSAVTLLTAALSGAAPAFQALRVQLSESLKGHQRLFGGPRSGAGLRNLLVAAQVALSLVLLTGAGIFIRGYQQTATADPGVETRQVLAMSLRLHGTKPGSWASFHRTLAEHLETVPGVKSVAYAARPPLHPDSILVQLPGQPAVGVQLNTVSPGYFATLGIPILRGRAIDVSDSGALHTVSRVVVSEGFAKEFWPRENALGKTFRTPAGGVLEVIGVARDTAVMNQGATDDPTIYRAWDPAAGPFFPVVRLAGDNGTMALAVRAAITKAFPNSAVDVRTIQSLMEESTEPFWNIAALVVILGGTALMLAVIGTYATAAFAASQRRKEVAIRIALGATKGDIFSVIVSSGLKPVAIGLLVGVVMAVALARVLEQAFRGAPFPLHVRDPLPYAAVCLVLAAATIAAMAGPARRASLCDPVEFLREE